MSHFDDDDDFDPNPSVMMDPDAGRLIVRKGEEINVSRIDPSIREITVGVGWDLKSFEGDPIDVDASIFLLNKNDQTVEDTDFIFYNNLIGRDGAVKHMGDSRTGAGDGDDEKIVIDLMALPFEIVKIAFVLSIYDMDLNASNFTMVRNVYFRIVNNLTELETFRFNLDDNLGNATGLMIGYLERIGTDWTYKALGQSIPGGLSKLASDYGIIVAQNVKS